MPDFGQYCLAARKYYKTLLGMGDRIAKTRVNNTITMTTLLEQYWDYQLYQNENIQGNDKCVFRDLVTRHVTKVTMARSTDPDGIKDLMATHIITDSVLEYVINRSEIYDYDIEDEYEIQEFCLSCLSLGLHLFFDRHGKLKSWIKSILTKAGCKIGGTYNDLDKKAILDGFLFQAVETSLVQTYQNADIPEFHAYRMMARKYIKETLGLRDKRTGTKENREITTEYLADRYRDILT